MVRHTHMLWMAKESRGHRWMFKELENSTLLAGDAVQCHLYVTDKSLSSNAGDLQRVGVWLTIRGKQRVRWIREAGAETRGCTHLRGQGNLS